MNEQLLPVPNELLKTKENQNDLEVLHDLIEINSKGLPEKIGRQLIHEIESTKLNTLVIWGLPGSGKTLLISQIQVELKRRGFDVTSLYFDEALKNQGMDTQNFRNITDSEWNRFSLRWQRQILKTRSNLDKQTAGDKKKRVLLVDTMSVGKRNRGVSSLKRLSSFSSKREGQFKFIAMVPHPKVQEMAMQMRKLVSDGSNVPDERIRDVIRQNFGVEVIVKGGEEAEIGRQIRKRIRNMSAPEENWFKRLDHSELTKSAIRKIKSGDGQWFPEIIELLVDAQDLMMESDDFERLHHSKIPEDIEQLSIAERENFRLLQTYFLFYAREYSNRDDYSVAVSPYKKSGIHWYLNPREEKPIPPPRSKFFLIRHGEQDRYRKTKARVTTRGVTQMRNFAEELSQRLRNQSGKYNIRILTSDRIRTVESAAVIEKTLRESVPSEVAIEETRVEDVLNTADSIGRLMEKYSEPHESILDTWFRLPNPELHKLKSTSPDEVADSTLNYVKELMSETENSTPGSVKINIMVTHESSIASILKRLGASYWEVPHASFVEIDIEEGKEPVFFYRGRQYSMSG